MMKNEDNNTLEQNIEAALQTGSLGLAGQCSIQIVVPLKFIHFLNIITFLRIMKTLKVEVHQKTKKREKLSSLEIAWISTVLNLTLLRYITLQY